MRRYTPPLLLGIVAGAFITLFAPGHGGARPLETFELGEHDHIIAEAPGCHAECRAFGGYRRTCTVRDFDCKAVCQDLPECNNAGRGVPKVCAIMRTR